MQGWPGARALRAGYVEGVGCGRIVAERTPAGEGAIFVLECAVPLDLSGELTCDWRDGDVW